jgi:hypothetical protein
MSRDATTLQLGVCARRGTVLAGLGAGDHALVAALDGTNDLTDLTGLARAHGLPAGRVHELLSLLAEAGVLVEDLPADRTDLARLGLDRRDRLQPDAEAWSLVHVGAGDGLRLLAERGRRRILVDGAGRVGAALALTLCAAGVGRVEVADPAQVRASDLLPAGHLPGRAGVDRASSVHARMPDASADREGIDPGAIEPGAIDLVVLVRDDVIDVRTADTLVREDQAHLALLCCADRVVIGPLVRPGRGPCLRCLDLHRADRDPAWPHLATQLLAQQGRVGARGEVASSTAAAGIAALQALTYLDGLVVPFTIGRTMEVTLPDGIIETRRWAAHPACGCIRPDPGPRGRAASGSCSDPAARAQRVPVADNDGRD